MTLRIEIHRIPLERRPAQLHRISQRLVNSITGMALDWRRVDFLRMFGAGVDAEPAFGIRMDRVMHIDGADACMRAVSRVIETVVESRESTVPVYMAGAAGLRGCLAEGCTETVLGAGVSAAVAAPGSATATIGATPMAPECITNFLHLDSFFALRTTAYRSCAGKVE